MSGFVAQCVIIVLYAFLVFLERLAWVTDYEPAVQLLLAVFATVVVVAEVVAILIAEGAVLWLGVWTVIAGMQGVYLLISAISLLRMR